MTNEELIKSIVDNNTSTTVDMGRLIREKIQKNYAMVLEQIEHGTWEKLSIGHLKALRDACSKELAKRGVKDEVD